MKELLGGGHVRSNRAVTQIRGICHFVTIAYWQAVTPTRKTARPRSEITVGRGPDKMGGWGGV